jgi:hypothetical protein
MLDYRLKLKVIPTKMSSHPDQCEAAACNLELAHLDAAFVDDDGGKRIFIRQVFLLAFVAIVASRG